MATLSTQKMFSALSDKLKCDNKPVLKQTNNKLTKEAHPVDGNSTCTTLEVISDQSEHSTEDITPQTPSEETIVKVAHTTIIRTDNIVSNNTIPNNLHCVSKINNGDARSRTTIGELLQHSDYDSSSDDMCDETTLNEHEIDIVQIHEQEREKFCKGLIIKRDGWRQIRPPRGYLYLFNDKDKSRRKEQVLSENEPMNSGIIVRDESDPTAKLYRRIETIDEYYKIYVLPNKTHFVHEVINGRNPYKAVFDIDVDTDKEEFKDMDDAKGRKLVENIIECIKLMFESEYRDEIDYEKLEYVICNSSGPDIDPEEPNIVPKYKPSYHIIFPYILFPNWAEAAAFTKKLRESDECCKLIDAGVNSVCHNLRILGSTKRGRTKRIDYELSTGKFWDLSHTLIAQTYGGKVLTEKIEGPKSKLEFESGELMSEHIKFCDKWLLDKYDGKTVYKHTGDRGFFKRVAHVRCFQCNRIHTSLGAVFVMGKGGWIGFICLAARKDGLGPITVRESDENGKKKRTLVKITGNLGLPVDCLRTYKRKWHRKCFNLTKDQLGEHMCKDLQKIAKYLHNTAGGIISMIEEVGMPSVQIEVSRALVAAARIFSLDKWGDKVGMDEVYSRLNEVQEYSSIVYEPNPLNNKYISPHTINMWDSWARKPAEKYDLTKCQTMLDHIRDIICSNDMALYDYMLQYCASMLQGKHVLVATVLYSKAQGVGKNLFTDYLSGIFGDHSTVANMEQFSGRFNEQYANKSLIVIDELSQKGPPSDRGSTLAKLKRFITASKMSYEGKGKAVFTLQNRAHLIFTTNWTGSIRLEDTDRRYNLIECSEKYIGDDDYFDKLLKHVANPTIAQESQEHFLRYMLDMRITIGMCKPYVTELKTDMQRIYNSTDTIIDFVNFVKINSHLVEYKDGEVLIMPQVLFDLYVKVFGDQDGKDGPKMTKKRLTQKLMNYREYTDKPADVYILETKSVRFSPEDVRRCLRINPKYVFCEGTKNTNERVGQL